MLTRRIRNSRSTDPAEKRALFRCVAGFYDSGWFGGNMIIFFFTLLLSPRYTGESSATRRALPRHASLEGFLQATSRLFGCHWDCLKRICFCGVLQGEKKMEEKSRSPLSTWHCCYAFVNIKATRLDQCVNWRFVVAACFWTCGDLWTQVSLIC